MAKDKLTDYDSVASSNLDVGGISVAEGMLPSGVNNAIREQMSHLADFAAGTSGVDVLKLQDDTDTNSIKLQAPASVTATTTFTLPDGDGASGQAMITDGAGTLSWAAPYGNRNLIINGAMAVSQRGTSTTSVTSTGYHACDRFKFLYTDAGTWTVSQSTDAPDGFANSFKVECTTAKSSLASNSRLFILQALEGQNLQQLKKGTSAAESITLSFYVRTNKTGTYQVHVEDNDNIRIIGSTYTVSSANTWQKVTVTFAGDTTGALDNDNGDSFAVFFALVAGTDNSSGAVPTAWEAKTNADRGAGLNVNLADATSNYWQITGVQLELGDTATPFEHRSYSDELARCQWYYERRGGASYQALGSGLVGNGRDQTRITLNYNEKRAVPSIAVEGSLISTNRENYEADITGLTGTAAGTMSAYLACTHSAAGTGLAAAVVTVKNGSPNSFFEIESEL